MEIKNYIIIIVFVLISSSIRSQNKVFYIQENHDFSILVDANATVEKQVDNGRYTETFVNTTKEGTFKYVITISKATAEGNTYEDLFTADFKDSYLHNCSCTIHSTDAISYNNYNAIRFKIEIIEKGQVLVGYSDNVISGDNLYNVIYLTLEDDFNKFKSEYDEFVSCMIINE